MDPNTTLAEMVQLADQVAAIAADADDDGDLYDLESAATFLAERALSLNAWIVAGGFLPAAWAR